MKRLDLLMVVFLVVLGSLATLAACGFWDSSIAVQPPIESSMDNWISPQITGVERQKVLAAMMRYPESARRGFGKNTAFFLIESEDATGMHDRIYVNRPELRGMLTRYLPVPGNPGLEQSETGSKNGFQYDQGWVTISE